MRGGIRVLAAIAVLAGIVSVVSAADTPEAMEVVGTVVSVDIRSFNSTTPVLPGGQMGEPVDHIDMIFVVKNETGDQTTIHWGDPMDATKAYHQDGNPALPKDIQPGTAVSVSAERNEENWVATEIHLR